MCRKSCDDDRLFNYLEKMCRRKVKLSKKNVDRNICHVCDHTCHPNDHICPRIADTSLLHTTYCCDYQCYPKLFQNCKSGQASAQCSCVSRIPSCQDNCVTQMPTDPCPMKKITCKTLSKKTCGSCSTKTFDTCKKPCDPCKKPCDSCDPCKKPCDPCKKPCEKQCDSYKKSYDPSICDPRDICDPRRKTCDPCRKTCDPCKIPCEPCKLITTCVKAPPYTCLKVLESPVYPPATFSCESLTPPSLCQLCEKQLNICEHYPEGIPSECQLCVRIHNSKLSCIETVPITCHDVSHHKGNNSCRSSCGTCLQKKVKVQLSQYPELKNASCTSSSPKCRKIQSMRVQMPTTSHQRKSNRSKKNTAKYQVVVTKVESLLKANGRDNYSLKQMTKSNEYDFH